MDSESDQAEMERFREQCRRQLRRSLDCRIRYGFCLVYKPVLDDAPYRSFDSTAEYRAWCDANLPEYLGYRSVSPLRSASEIAEERAREGEGSDGAGPRRGLS